MKKNLFKLTALVLALALMVGCSSGSSTTSGTETTEGVASDEVITLEFGHIQNPGHALYIAAEEMKELIEEYTDGRVVVNLYPASQLGSAREMMEQVTMGTLDMTFADASDWASALSIPELGVFNLPFLSKDLETQSQVIVEVVPEVVPDMLEGSGVQLLTTYSNGIRQPLLVDAPIYTLEDIQGLKMRVPETTLYVELWNALGASTVTSAWSESYTVVQQGVADAVEADDVGLVSMNLQEVGNYMSKIGHLGQAYLTFINEDKWNSIPADLQELIMQAVEDNQAKQLADREQLGVEAEETIEAAGVIINEITAEERARMREACQSIYDVYAVDYGLADLIERIEAYNN